MNHKISRTSIFAIAGYLLLVISGNSVVLGQEKLDRTKNNPYAPSPAGRSQNVEASLPKTVASNNISFVMQPAARLGVSDNPDKTSVTAPVPEAAPKSSSPTEIYRVGINDVLYIKLHNAVSGSDYYTVRPDGTIDFPLAGERVVVADLTVDQIERTLVSAIKLFQDPKVEVRIRDYASHKIKVSGTVENPGEKSLQREAVPFFVIKAAAIVSPETGQVKITASGQTKGETYDIADPRLEGLLIYPGAAIEFIPAAKGNYFVTGKHVTAGQKTISGRLTLLQAVIAAQNGREAKKAVIRRRTESGVLNNTEFDLRAVRSGRIADPVISSGDIIDISN